MNRMFLILTAFAFSLHASVVLAADKPRISPAMHDSIQAHMRSMVDNEPKNLSLITDADVSLVHELWRIAGTTPETHPLLYRNLRYAARHDQKHRRSWQTSPYEAENPLGYTEDVQQITSLALDTEGNIVASAYYSAVESNLISGTISLQIWGHHKNGVWGPISNSTTVNVDDTTCSNIIDVSNSVPLSSLDENEYTAYRAQMSWTVVDNLNRAVSSNLTLTSADVPQAMTLLAPRPVNGNDYIKVCMNREDRYGKDCDYVINSEKEIVAFPLKGSVVFSGPIWAPGEKPGYNPVVDIKTVKLPLGGGCELKDLENSFWELPGVKVDGARVSWDISAEEFQEQQKTCFGYGDRALFSMNISAYLKEKEGPSSFVSASFSNNQNTRVGAGTMKMDPMQVFYGCLAEDTEVTVAGLFNRKMKIQAPGLIGKTVSNRNGIQDLLVAGNAYGYETRYMLEISTDNNHSVTLTEDHPIWVNGSFINAIDTQLKDKVMTSKGEETVTGLRLVDSGPAPAKVWNIFLERPPGSGIAPIDERGFYANGLLVGDGSVQEYNMLWEANAACRNKSAKRQQQAITAEAGELQPEVTSAKWDEASATTVVKWTVKNENPLLFSYILTTRTGDVQQNVGEVPKSQLCASFPSRTKPGTVIVTGSDGTSPTGLPSNPPTPVEDGQDSCP